MTQYLLKRTTEKCRCRRAGCFVCVVYALAIDCMDNGNNGLRNYVSETIVAGRILKTFNATITVRHQYNRDRGRFNWSSGIRAIDVRQMRSMFAFMQSQIGFDAYAIAGRGRILRRIIRTKTNKKKIDYRRINSALPTRIFQILLGRVP